MSRTARRPPTVDPDRPRDRPIVGCWGTEPQRTMAGSATKENEMKGIRWFLRNFTASAVKEHLRSAIETSGGSPDLTRNEIELVRFICEGSFDWDALLGGRPGA
jgi:hypothetical protein